MNDHAPPLTETAPKRRHVGQRFFPEMGVGGFSHVDGSIAFYSQIAALLKPADRVLDFGAGRGEQIIDDPVAYRRRLVNFKGRCARVDGCDIDPVVRTNPYLDSAEVLTPGEPLPTRTTASISSSRATSSNMSTIPNGWRANCCGSPSRAAGFAR